MISASFAEANAVLGPPEGMTDEQVQYLNVYRGEDAEGASVVISCWKMTIEEMEEFQRTGRIWLHVMGLTMQPVHLSANNPWGE
jgi:hypothetical protein